MLIRLSSTVTCLEIFFLNERGQPMVLKSLRSYLALLALLFVVFGCSVETQKARESFDNQALPEELSKLANQTMELSSFQNDIVARVQTENKNENLSVAVIDNGMDIAHPDLVAKYDYQIENGKIVGVGHDFMGDDNYPSAVLINPELFAFTAVEIKNGLIVRGNENVFKKMLALDAQFSKLFIEKLKADPILSQSLFAKITDKSFNVFGLYKFIISAKIAKGYFDPDTYKENKDAGKLLNLNFRQDVVSSTALQERSLYEAYYFLDKQAPWTFLTGSGMSDIFYSLTTVEHGDLMFKLITDTFNEFLGREELKAGIEKVVDFRLGRNHALNTVREDEVSSACNFLSEALEYHKRGTIAADPITHLIEQTVSERLSILDLNRAASDYPVLTLNQNSYFDALNSGITKIKIYGDAVQSIEKTASEQLDFKTYNRNLNTSLKAAKAFSELRASELQNLFNPNFKSEYTSLYRKHFFRSMHPYISSFSENESHGTHTSGIVAKQNANLRIYPIRITTRSALVTKQEKAQLLEKFATEFQAWLSRPVVARAIYRKLPKLVGITPVGPNAEPTTQSEREVFAKLLMQKLKTGMDVAFEENPLDFLFFRELEESFLHVAEKKIKVASISLGTEASNRIPQFKDLDPEIDLRTVFTFLNFEFVKFHLGEIISTKAKDTLFVVAAGNSKTWIDGKTHSALPVDMSSRFLKPFEDDTNYYAPNNHLVNILGVGSLSPDEDLSDFTNVLLGLKTNIIFAVGEDVLSPIKSTDLSPVLSVVNKKIPQLNQPVSVADTRMLPKLLELDIFAPLKDNDKAQAKISTYLSSGFNEVAASVSAFKRHLAMQYSDHREQFSGTSMATPAVAGVIGDLILKKAKNLKLGTTEIYTHPDFTPEILIKDLKATSTPLFPESPEYDLRKIDVRGKYDRGDKIQALELYLQSILN